MPLIAAELDVLGHLSSHSPKMFLSVLFLHCLLTWRKLFLFASWGISPHPSNCTFFPAAFPDRHALPPFRHPTLGAPNAVCHHWELILGLGGGEDLRPTSPTHCLGHHLTQFPHLCKGKSIAKSFE